MGQKVACPYCRFEMSLKVEREGRFKPTCRKCKQPFQLTISAPAEGSGELELDVRELAGQQPFSDLETRLDGPPTKPDASAAGATRESAGKPAPETTGQVTRAADTEQTMVVSDAEKSEGAARAAGLSASPSGTYGNVNQPTRADVSAEGNSEPLGRLGGYRLLKELGRGGMGSVYLAKQLSLGRRVAIKTIRGKWASNPRAIARFIREAYAAAQLVHHNVVQIYDLDQDNGTNFFSDAA